MGGLEDLRSEIDDIDNKILKLLNRRARVALKVGEIKRVENRGFYSPQREREILQRLKGLNKGPFPNDAMQIVFKEIFSASLSLEKPIDVSCLGPLASFTHLAGLRHFGSSANFIPANNVKGIFEMVDCRNADYGIVPIENSNEGVVSHTLDLFVDFDLKITAEMMLEVTHNLLSLSGDMKKIRKLYSHPQPIGQCRQWLERNLPDITIFEVLSTSKAAEMASREPDAAAIASELAAKMYNLNFVERSIEDNKQNYTRFLIISPDGVARTGRDKTSLMLSIKDKPGALFDILSPFKNRKINLTKIESRPSRRKAWEYIFFIDMEGHIEDTKLRKAVEEVKDHCLYLKVLGSYPLGD